MTAQVHNNNVSYFNMESSSGTDKHRDDLESEDFVGKVSKFEFLSHNKTSPPCSSDKQRWAVYEGLRFPSKNENISTTQHVTGKPPQVPTKSKQGPPTPPKPQNLCNHPLALFSTNEVSQNSPSSKSTTEDVSSRSSVDNCGLNNLNVNIRKVSEMLSSSTNSNVMNASMIGKHSSIEDLNACEANLEEQHRKVKQERIHDQELEQQEKVRLQEILSLCADYERQLVTEKQVNQQLCKPIPVSSQPTGIKTNGSLPRDTPPIRCNTLSSTESTSPPPDSFGRKFSHSTSSDDELFFASSNKNSKNNNNDSNENALHSSQINRSPLTVRTGIKTVPSTNLRNAEVIENKYVSCYNSPNNEKNNLYSSGKQNTAIEVKNLVERSKSSPIQPYCVKNDEENRVYLSLTRTQSALEVNIKDQLKRLKFMKCDTEKTVCKLKRQIKDKEDQENELYAEYDMEKALLECERQTQLSDIECDKQRLAEINRQENELYNDSNEQLRVKNEDLIQKSKDQLDVLHKTIIEVREKLEDCDEDDDYSDKFQELHCLHNRTQENIETETKVFEDLEFQKLEHEAHREEERETLQHRLNIEKNIVNERIKLKTVQVSEIESQQSMMTDVVRTDAESLEGQRQILLEEFRKEKSKYIAILKRIAELVEKQKNTKDDNVASSNDSSSSCKSSDDDDDINMVHNHSLNHMLAELKIVSPVNSVAKQTDDALISKVACGSSISSDCNKSVTLQEVERNRQNILGKQGARVLEEERDRVQKLKKRVSDEVRSQWQQNQRHKSDADTNICNANERVVNNLMDSDEDEQETCSTTSCDIPSTTDTLSSGDENTTPSGSTVITTPDIHHDAMKNTAVPNSEQNISNRSNEVVRRREKWRNQRPLTRYLPIRENNFNLKLHIESAGHQIDICKDQLNISSQCCRGYLYKLGHKFKNWKKRWFVFDRNRRALLYYADKHEKKAKKGVYFKNIEEVYVDHQNRVKSPNNGATFCMKTIHRLYFFVAPSPEAMRIWVDVIFTGAEGYQEFMLDA